MTGVQLIGVKAVLSRFETFDSDAWALYQSKQFIVGGLGSEQLDGWLKDFEASGSTATYMIRVYNSDEAPTSSTGNTDYIACFSFKVVDQYEGYGIAGHNTKLMDRIGALEQRIKDQDEGGDDGEDLNSIIMGWLSDPAKLNQVAGAVRTILGGSGPVQSFAPAAPVQAIAGVGAVDADPVTRIAAALDKLEKKDPKLVEHLEKLALLAENDPGLFKAVISKLDLL